MVERHHQKGRDLLAAHHSINSVRYVVCSSFQVVMDHMGEPLSLSDVRVTEQRLDVVQKPDTLLTPSH